MKRIMIATLFGVVAGAICAILTFSFDTFKFTAVTLGWILLNRTVMGFVIGVSGLRLHWAWNGIVIGLIVGSIFSYFLYMQTGNIMALLVPPIGNAFFGLMIEFFTSFVFKQRAFPRSKPLQLAAAA